MRGILAVLLIVFSLKTTAQNNMLPAENKAAKAWADSVYNTLSDTERIAQLMVIRLSTYDFKKNEAIFFDKQVDSLVREYNIGSICLFQGNPVQQATILNHLQSITKTPILTCIDAEWGIGMRMFDSVQPLPHQMMLGAMDDAAIVYQYGKIVGEQCKRLGINVNYAPVVDINNNPNNPVINDRSFGEDKYKVALFGIQYMKGMQDVCVMACAKHFPGHGDVSVDSHFDLPVITKSMAQLDSLELYPFKQIFNAGIGSVMIAHLYIPAIDSTVNQATSISKNNVTGLMRNQLGYQGLTFTDALEMQGVKKYFPDGKAAVQALIAGNDMLCLPGDVPQAIKKIKEAIDSNLLSWNDIEMHCKKVLMIKYQYDLSNWKPVNTSNLTADLNKDIPAMRKLVAQNAITLLNKTDSIFFPLLPSKSDSVAYVGIGLDSDNVFAQRMKTDYNATVFYFNYKKDSVTASLMIDSIKSHYKNVVIGIHNYNRAPLNNFGISAAAINLADQLQQVTNSITFVFGNPYVIKNWCSAKNLVACYEDDSIIQNIALDMLQGKIPYKGKLPVTVCDIYKFGSGIISSDFFLPRINPDEVGLDVVKLNKIDSIAKDAIVKGATPGCVILVARDGKIVTKICATTLAIMKLYDEGKIDLDKKLGDYLPLVKGTDKENLLIKNILLHQAGLVPLIWFYKETIDTNGNPYPKYYSAIQSDSFTIRVAQNLYLRNDWKDTMFERILQSPLTITGKYFYSDIDFILLGKVVEAISGLSLDEYVQKEFYEPLGLANTAFNPLNHFPINQIAPTEQEKVFRKQLIRGDVHDPGAAMLGGVSGHAGLFSDAYDIAILVQMLLNGGEFNDKRYLQKRTIDLFTSYQSKASRRGYGFDKPEKDNYKRADPYPCFSASPLTFGHTGFTGTCVWVDPKHNLTFIFLSNRITPESNNEKLVKMNVRSKIEELIYSALLN